MAKKSKFNAGRLEQILAEVEKESQLYDYRTKDYPLEVICGKYGEEGDESATLYVPEYQREFVWKPDRQSKFIESVLLGVPLTPFLLSEDDNGRLEIIDGSQRIRTLIAFYENRLSLRKIEKLKELNSAKFKDLPLKLQNSIKNRDFRVIVVDDANIEIRKDIFERINTTSEKLTDAEIRRGSFSGAFYDLVLELKDYPDFTAICPVSKAKKKRGEYEELVLRFFAYIDRYLSFKHDVAIFLNDYLQEMNDSDFDIELYRHHFNKMVIFIKENFPIGFRKEENSKSTPRVRFEAIAVGSFLALQENPDLTDTPVSLEWLDSDGFKEQTTSDASNNPDRLKNRVEFVRDALLGKLDEGRLKNG